MINKKQSIILIILGVFLITWLATGCSSEKNMLEKNMESVQAMENFSTDGLTLLERTYDDTDSDGDKESIEVYTSAQIARDGQMGWDTGHQWVLLVRKGEEVFPLFDDYVQHGELQFWIAGFNQDKIESPESTDLQRQIYVTVTTGVGFKLLDYYWDEQNHCYQKEVVLNPPDQWIMRHSNKYNIPDLAKIESLAASGTETKGNTDDYNFDYDATDPVDVVRADYMSWLKEDYTISMNVLNAEVDATETQRHFERYKGSELAETRGWTDEYLDQHFIVVKVRYECEFDHTKTFMRDGLLEGYVFLTRDPESGAWTVVDRTSPSEVS
jgi:hypothetical protein